MRYVFALLSVVSAWGIMPASAQECEPEVSLAIVERYLHGGICPTPCGAGPEHSNCQRR
jgi:hypothetical protein